MKILGPVSAVIFACLFIYQFIFSASSRARKSFLKATGNPVVKDYGSFGKSRIFTWQQDLRLFKLEKNGQQYFVIEELARQPWWIIRVPQINWLKLDAEGARNLVKIVSSKDNSQNT